MLMRKMEQEDNSDNENEEEENMDSQETGDNGDGCDSTELETFLLSTKSGHYCFVHKICITTDRKKNQQTRKASLSHRANVDANFRVVLKWLLGKKQEAEVEARHLVRKYPFSFVAAASLFYIVWKKGERTEAAQHLLPLMKLKSWRPDIYEGVMCEELAELGHCYMELGPEFIPDAMGALEEVIYKKPYMYPLKWHLGLNLRRLTNAKHIWTQSLNDVVTPLLKATELLLELIQGSNKVLRTAAAAELGEILNSCEFDEKLKNTVGQRALDAGLNAAECFGIVMQEEDAGGSNLVRAGKYFRYTGQLHKSEKTLKKAVAVQDSPKVHHQLALTLKKLAIDERRRARQNFKQHQQQRKDQLFRLIGPRHGESRQSLGVISHSRCCAGNSEMASLERAMKSIVYQVRFSREDKYVNETMHHLNKALMLSQGENRTVSYDLGLMYKALGEYSDALEQFRVIAEIDTEPSSVITAFEQSGLVTLEKCSLEENETRARALQEDGISMLNMAILIQSQIVQQFREVGDHESAVVWRSCYTLGQYLRLQQEVEEVSEEDSPVEIWLLRLLRVYADTLPVLTSLQQFTLHDVQSPQELMGKLRKYLRDRRHEDAVLFIHLLRLTQQGKVIERCDSFDSSLSLRAHILAAREKLMKDLETGYMGGTINTNIS